MEYADIARDLEARLATLTQRLEAIKKDASQSHSSDFAEQAQERENDEVVDAIGNETDLSIRRIRAALERIENGSYGCCESCGEKISPSRLKVLPETTLCVNCAS